MSQLDFKKIKDGAMACLGQDKPACDMADYLNNSIPGVRAYNEEGDLVVRGGDRYLVIKRVGPDLFHVAENVTIPSTNLVDHGGGVSRNLDHLLHEIAALPR